MSAGYRTRCVTNNKQYPRTVPSPVRWPSSAVACYEASVSETSPTTTDAPAAKPVPVPTPETLPFWAGCARSELWIQFCGACAAHYFYPRPACPGCGRAESVSWVRASGAARLSTYVIQHVAAPGYDPPFVIAIVELEEGVRMMTNLVGVAAEPSALELGMPLVVDFEPRGETAVPVFRPARP